MYRHNFYSLDNCVDNIFTKTSLMKPSPVPGQRHQRRRRHETRGARDLIGATTTYKLRHRTLAAPTVLRGRCQWWAALRGCCAHLSADHALHRGRWLDARPFFSSGDVNEWDKEKLEALGVFSSVKRV